MGGQVGAAGFRFGGLGFGVAGVQRFLLAASGVYPLLPDSLFPGIGSSPRQQGGTPVHKGFGLFFGGFAAIAHDLVQTVQELGAELGNDFMQRMGLANHQSEELRAGQSLCGIHREDIELLLDDHPAKVFASQGQQRSVVLSLKMAEAAAAARITGEHPVLLLDDVLSELDESRKQYLLTRMKEKRPPSS